jgi:hypothetical protein
MTLKLNVSDMAIRQLFKDIGGLLYWIQVGQRLTKPNMQAKMAYCGTFLAMVYEDSHFLRICHSPMKVTFTWIATSVTRQVSSLALSGQMLSSRNRYIVHV